MADYHLITIWRIEAPLSEVYGVIHDALHWPDWWPGVARVEQVASGDANGIDCVLRYVWQGELPYRVVFDVRATRIDDLVTIEGYAHGDLEGTGRWHFSRQGAFSVVHFEWHVRSTRLWMNLSAPFARSIFVRNHVQIMEQGGKGLARRLGVPVPSQENIDLTADAVLPKKANWRNRQLGGLDPVMVLIAGLAAGTIATLVQLVLWWLFDIPLRETIFRDIRLTAALIMGSDILPPMPGMSWSIFLVSMLIHTCLSVLYALLPAWLIGRWPSRFTVLTGALYGLAIFVVNLYGFTILFPWFAVARDWITLLAHLAFGVVLVMTCRIWAVTGSK